MRTFLVFAMAFGLALPLFAMAATKTTTACTGEEGKNVVVAPELGVASHFQCGGAGTAQVTILRKPHAGELLVIESCHPFAFDGQEGKKVEDNLFQPVCGHRWAYRAFFFLLRGEEKTTTVMTTRRGQALNSYSRPTTEIHF